MRLFDAIIRCADIGYWGTTRPDNVFRLTRKSQILAVLTAANLFEDEKEIPLSVSVRVKNQDTVEIEYLSEIAESIGRETDDWVWVDEFLDYLKGAGQGFDPKPSDREKILFVPTSMPKPESEEPKVKKRRKECTGTDTK